MLKYIRQNKNIIVVAVALFMVSMSTLMFFLGANNDLHQSDYKTNVMNVETTKTQTQEPKTQQNTAPAVKAAPSGKKIKNSPDKTVTRLMAEKPADNLDADNSGN